VVFIDRNGGEIPSWTRDPRVVPRPTRIGPSHAIASAAIPLLFPPVKIDGAYYSDGGLRQNTPLSPVLRLGADRVLVIGLRHEDPTRMPPSPGAAKDEAYPGALYLLGKVADALMLDRLEYDLLRLEGFNMLIGGGAQTYGDKAFVDTLHETSMRMRGARYRHIHTLVIRPSRDIGEMSSEFLDVFRTKLGPLSGWLFGKIADDDFLGESDLLSYMLFDGRLATALIELGRADADAARSKLIEFFKD
jgi:NTE family protein